MQPPPKMGSPVVEGIAVGRAVVWARDPPPRPRASGTALEHGRLERAIAVATRGVEELVRVLPRAESELFEPELAILAELGPTLLAKVKAGARADEAVDEATSEIPSDLLLDARARLLDALAHDERSVASLLEGRGGERVLVTHTLTPSVVASLPARVIGIVAAADDAGRAGSGHGSHAAILARGRDITLAFVDTSVVDGVAEDDVIVLDASTTPACVWISPPDSVVEQAQVRRDAWLRERSSEEEAVAWPLAHLKLEVRVNVASLYDHVPAAADGIGLVRTELVFSDHSRAPTEPEQFVALAAIGALLGEKPVVVRLFDAAEDKPLGWLPPLGGGSGGKRARGIELLLAHPEVLDAQLRALMRVANRSDLRVLLPFVTSADEVTRVRARVRGKLSIGAMIESPEAVARIDEIVQSADFIAIGTNDLSAIVTGQTRADSTLEVDKRVLRMIERIVASSHAHARNVTVCGELAGDPHSARIMVGIGVDAISVSTSRFARVKRSLREISLDDCRSVAREALR